MLLPSSDRARAGIQPNNSLHEVTPLRKIALLIFIFGCPLAMSGLTPPRFEVSLAASAASAPITGRLIVVLAPKAEPEPRLTISPTGPAIYAVDLNRLAPPKSAIVDENALGYPRPLAQLPEGDYFAQAIINVYSEFHRSDGKTVWVHMGDGHVEAFQIAPGNLYSDVKPVHVGDGGTIKLEISPVIPPATELADTA